MADISGFAPEVRISLDEMEAFLYLPVPIGDNFIVEDLEDALKRQGVVYGIDSEILKQMVEEKIYGRATLVAKGVPVQEGVDGYYDYHFNVNPDGKPKVNPDGSVDYWSIQKMEPVQKGQVIATYHPAVMGVEGMTVRGQKLLPNRARQLMPLRGKGFTRSEDNTTYTADFDGKIEVHGERIMVLQLHEISGDADLSVGNIDFHGDVVIHGNVCAGLQIKTTGSITVDGLVEAAHLWAGKDILLRGGMMGEQRSTVYAKGNIQAKFFEYTTVAAGGDIQAEVLMNCQVTSKQKITLSGKKAGIIGGKVSAIQGIEVGNIGNEAEILTEVSVGNGIELHQRIHVLQKQLAEENEVLERVENGLKELAKLEQENVIEKDDPRKVQLLRVKVQKAAVLGSLSAELQRLNQELALGQGASIRVHHEIHPRVTVTIDDAKYLVKTMQSHIEFKKAGGEVFWQYNF